MLERLGKALEAQYGTDYQLSDADSKYFEVFYDSKGILTLVREKADVIKQAGYTMKPVRKFRNLGRKRLLSKTRH